ncbi:hypothetical protein PQQ81_09675 [Paraburkholderia strydomiana]|uniref:hypothetical protein n=1 Tax=Paraburkholderia strydomiana TaxID=1245417 RepID=UPI0038BB5500
MDFARMLEYMRSAEFAGRFEAAVAAGEQSGFGASAEEVGEEMAEAQGILDELGASGRHKALCLGLHKLLQSPGGYLQVNAAATATATVLLLAKTAMLGEDAKLLAEARNKLEPLRALPVLVELAYCLIDGELAGRDSFGGQAIIDDALLQQRISAIRQVLDCPKGSSYDGRRRQIVDRRQIGRG